MIPENYVPKVGDVVITKGYSPAYDGRPLTIKRIGQGAQTQYCYFKEAEDKSYNFLASDIVNVLPKKRKFQTDSILKSLTEPVMQYLRENYHPHVKLIIDSDKAELMEGIFLNTNKNGSSS